MLRRAYNWTISFAGHPHAMWYLALISFAESSFFPIPPDVLLVPMTLARPASAWIIAGVSTVSSVLGGLAGYAIGYFLYETIGEPLIAFYGYQEKFLAFQDTFQEYGAWVVAMFGLTPFPYKVITISSGVAHLDVWTFALASLASRGARFYLEAALLRKYGAPIRTFIEQWLGWITFIFFVGLFGGFLALKYL